jgi:diguanylate cyclase (GGDEF)-like protein/PAS domain S-box-containing protein
MSSSPGSRKQYALRLRPVDPLRHDARKFKALHEIAVAIGAARDFDDLAQRVTRHTCDLLKADGAVLQVWDERAGIIRDVSGYEATPTPFPVTLRLGEGIAGQTAQRRQVVVVEDYATWEHAIPVGVEHGVRSALAAPLLVADRLIGVLTVHFFAAQEFVHDQAEVLALLAAQLAPAVELAQLYAARASLYERERLLRDMSRSLASDLDEAHVLELAARHVSELVAAPYTRVWLAQPDGTLCRGAGMGYPDEGESTLPAASLAGSALTNDRRIFVDDVSQHPAWRDRGFVERTNLRPYLAVPIHRADLSLGVVVAMREGGAIFREDDERLLVGLADAIAVALVNARSLSRMADSEQRLRAMFEAIACGVLVQDPDGVILHANSAAEEIFGYSLDQMRGRSSLVLWKAVGEDGVERPPTGRNVIIAARTGVSSRNFTTCIVLPDGRRRWLQGNAVPIRAIDGAVQVVSSFIDISERKRAEEAIAHQARHDALTGLPNRSLLGERLRQSIDHAEAAAAPVGLLLIDLDHFKEVNDTLGHQAGDALLQQVAERLGDVVRDSDTVARLGGDEFAILLPNTDAAESLLVAGKLLEALRRPLRLEGQAVAVSGSVGVAVYPTHGRDATTLLRRADVAMYVAKRSDAGASLYSAAQDGYAPDRLALLPQLREAIENPTEDNGLVLHYQPQLDLRTGQLNGVEALVRWQHAQHGLLGPDRFVPLAEQTGMVRSLSQWVLETALSQAQRWAAKGTCVPVAVNLSMRDLQDIELPEAVSALLGKYNVAGAGLGIEITESTLMADPERALDVLQRLRGMGVRIAIDDFGTGYSSLAYLKRLPVHELKIDRSFVHDVSVSLSDRAIVRSIIELAHNLGLQVVAEGVENEATWRLLGSLGCDFAQGFHMSRPLPSEQFERWLNNMERRAA